MCCQQCCGVAALSTGHPHPAAAAAAAGVPKELTQGRSLWGLFQHTDGTQVGGASCPLWAAQLVIREHEHEFQGMRL
jgi:hypothetical protein